MHDTKEVVGLNQRIQEMVVNMDKLGNPNAKHLDCCFKAEYQHMKGEYKELHNLQYWQDSPERKGGEKSGAESRTGVLEVALNQGADA